MKGMPSKWTPRAPRFHALEREQSKANKASGYFHSVFLFDVLGIHKVDRYKDGGPAMLTNREHARRRARGKAQRQARKANRA